MERWLSQRLSGRLGTSDRGGDGVCANVLFPPPGRLLAAALADASGIDPQTDPWLPERLVWPLLEVVDDHLGEPWLAPLATHLGGVAGEADAVRRNRRLSVVRRLAGLLSRYAVHRPEMLIAWSGGETPESGAGSWQSPLWRALRERIAVADPAERLAPACARLREDAAVGGLGPRLGVFGLTRLAAAEVEILRALAAQRSIHLFLLHPSPALWTAVARLAPAQSASAPPREDDPTADVAINPLLASWGRDSREMQLIVGGGDAVEDHHHPTPPRQSRTLLARIQDDIVADRSPPGAPTQAGDDERIKLADGDRSIQVHACHGRARQVEILREAILHLLAEDPSLEPRDVLVMCPDIETFAPLIAATFAAGADVVDDDSTDDPDGRPASQPPRQARRPLTAPDEPDPVRHRRPARPRRGTAHRLRGPRPRRARTRPPALSLQRRRPHPPHGVDRADGDPLGHRRPAPCAVQAAGGPGGDVGERARPNPARGGDGRGGTPGVRAGPAARRRRGRRGRARRSPGGVLRPAAACRGEPLQAPTARRVARRPAGGDRTAQHAVGPGELAVERARAAARRSRRRGRRPR